MMKKTGWMIIVVAIVAIAMVLVYFYYDKKTTQIRIGWIGPLTGDAAYYGEMVKNATEMAVEEINKEGGIKGKRIRVIYEDDQLDPKKGTLAFTK